MLVTEAPRGGPFATDGRSDGRSSHVWLQRRGAHVGRGYNPVSATVPESALLMPSRASQLDVVCGDETPTPLEAARRLARCLDEVRVEREPPLVASPPRQRTPVRRPPPLRPRSSRIAAQPLAHIPASRRGEVLLNKRLGIAPPTAPVSPVSRGILDALRSGTLSASEVEALDALFPAFNGRMRELFQGDS